MSADEKLAAAKAHAKAAGLRYVYDVDPGLTRRKRGKGFCFYDAKGKQIKDDAVVARCRKLAIPPAWRAVWISPLENGHIQATGLDARGRKQYRYHADWRTRRDENKFENMLVFGNALPGLRRAVTLALNEDTLTKDRVTAAVVRLLDKTGLRIGNDSYMAENATFGLSTISKKHVEVHGKAIELDFPGKGGKVWQGGLTDPKVAKVIGQCEDLPGYRLFKWMAEDGTAHEIGSADINTWLQEKSGEAVTAKDFRTWAACSLFLDEALALSGNCDGVFHLKPVLKSVSSQLGNTPAILQKSYVHPELVDLYRTGCFLEKEWAHDDKHPYPGGLRRTEGLLLRWLEKKYG